MIFLDSSYIKGLILKNDDNNRYSKNIKLLLKNETKAINVTVLLEALNAVRKNNYQDDVDDLLDCLINFDIFDILLVPDYEQSLKWFKYYGKTINFADCTIINTMVKHKITKIASFDSDFDKIKGFERIFK